LEVWIKKAHGGDLSVSVGIFFLNSSLDPSKGLHGKEAGTDSGSGDGDAKFTGGLSPLTLE
jgi:hypothetical protein